MSSEVLEKRIIENEGYRNKIYKDTRGFPTIGVGHLVTENDEFEEGKEYSKEILMTVFRKDVAKAEEGAKKLIGHIEGLHPEAKNLIIEMVFQMGTSGVSKFAKMLLALEEKNYKEAAVQMLDSRWARQTPQRCQRMAKMMETCI